MSIKQTKNGAIQQWLAYDSFIFTTQLALVKGKLELLNSKINKLKTNQITESVINSMAYFCA